MKELKLFLSLTIAMLLIVAITVFTIAYIEVAIKYLFSLVSTLSPINRTPVVVLICSFVPITILSLLIASDERVYK